MVAPHSIAYALMNRTICICQIKTLGLVGEQVALLVDEFANLRRTRALIKYRLIQYFANHFVRKSLNHNPNLYERGAIKFEFPDATDSSP
jgi:hypothetical protein